MNFLKNWWQMIVIGGVFWGGMAFFLARDIDPCRINQTNKERLSFKMAMAELKGVQVSIAHHNAEFEYKDGGYDSWGEGRRKDWDEAENRLERQRRHMEACLATYLKDADLRK